MRARPEPTTFRVAEERTMERRVFLQGMGVLAAGSTGAFALPVPAPRIPGRAPGTAVRLSLNAYSFNVPLRDGTMTVADMIAFCAKRAIGALDLTAYYIKGYPAVPEDAELFRIKRLSFVNGVALSGTGVRNDFTMADEAAHRAQVQLVKDWIVAAEKLGVPTVRVFAGREVKAGEERARLFARVVQGLHESIRFGRDHGIVVAIQNHNDFLKTAEQTVELVKAVDSEWVGVTLDVGSLRSTADPYAEIHQLTPYAVSWQLKELVYYGEQTRPIDLARIKSIVDEVGYRGVLQIETLGAGDPVAKIDAYLAAVRRHFPG
jgi:sugar phosphate isomerase/epimerase